MKKMTAFIGMFVFCLLRLHLAWTRQAGSSSLANWMLLRPPQSDTGVVPRLVKFSGVLKDRMGKVPTGEVGLTFSLYALQEGGSPLWSESQTVKLDEQGRYTVLLGWTFPEGLPPDLFTTDHELWLGVQPQLPGEGGQPRVDVKALGFPGTRGPIPATLFGMHTGERSNWPTVSFGALG